MNKTDAQKIMDPIQSRATQTLSFSLLLTGLDSSLAFAGVGLNLVILIAVLWSQRSSS